MSDPYMGPIEYISDITPYIRKNVKDQSMTFVGESLEIRIPRKFEQHGMLIVSNSVIAPGVFDMVINGKYAAALNLLAQITIHPTDISSMTYDGVDYVVLHLTHGDTFMESYNVVQNDKFIYVLWTEFINNGGLPYWFDYRALLRMFEHARELTGNGIGVSQSVYEGIIAHLSRNPDNISQQYRLTDMKGKMLLVAIKSVSQAPESTIARLNGSYFADDGLTSALIYKVEQNKPFEDLLRGVSTGAVQAPNEALI